MKRTRRISCLLTLAALLGGIWFQSLQAAAAESGDAPLLISAREENVTVITDLEGLRAMEQDPMGTYRLEADIDAAGTEWFPFSFHGNLDGNGHTILNLSICDAGETIRETYDGNMKVYDTYFAALFDELSDGFVGNLNLVNLRIKVETDKPCFVGAIAGYLENAVIENCTVQGTLELWAHDRMFGVGGIIGYGCGTIRDSKTNVTLICVDTDSTTKDEQFMGGICAAGYPDVTGCEVAIRGFDSDHGYVHDGGLIGMYMFYPKGTKYRGTIKDNYVSGKITFFEDNKNRRAYCTGFIGEIMNWDFENGRNKNDFVRDEVFKYDVNLLPHSCENPVMTEEVVEATCEFGYTRFVCETCGYEETDHYTLKNHAYEWTVEREATTEEEGLRRGICKDCGAESEEAIPKATPEPTLEPAPVEETPESLETVNLGEDAPGLDAKEGEDAKTSSKLVRKIGAAGIVLVVAGLFIGIIFFVRKRRVR